MSRVMLINGQHAEELRVAIVADGTLESFQVEVAESGLERGNIYRGIVANIEPSLDAAFIDYGNVKHGFLAGHDVVAQACHHSLPSGGGRRPAITEVLEKGSPIMVQVTRDAMGTKGAVLTTNLSFPGRYLVLMPYDSMRGLSRKIEDETLRKQVKEKAKSLVLPDGYGYIVRTSAVDQTKAALKTDVTALLRLSKRVLAETSKGQGPRLLYDDQDLVVQALRDYLDASISEVLIDDEQLLRKAESYVRATMPRSKVKLSRYNARVPLFSRYNLEPQIDSIYKRNVALSSGGTIVIDHTEALTAIDVNSGRDTSGATQEETAYNTNMVAAEEVARQLRLRDIGGLVVVDFIDMRSRRHRAAVERAMRDALKADKARVVASRISSNGLLEINRQRLKQALGQRMHRRCPTCKGIGLLPAPELVGLRLLRRIEARAATGRLRRVRVLLHPELADVMQNQRRRQLASLEHELGISIEIIASPHLHRADEEIEWINREPSSDQWVAVDDRVRSARGRPAAAAAGSGRRKPRRNEATPGALAVMETAELRTNGKERSLALVPVETTISKVNLELSDGGDNEPPDGPNAEDADATNGRGRRRRRRPRRRRRRTAMSPGAQNPPPAGLDSSDEQNGTSAEPDARAAGAESRSLTRQGGEPSSPPLAQTPTLNDGLPGSGDGKATVAGEGSGSVESSRRSSSRRRRRRRSSGGPSASLGSGTAASERDDVADVLQNGPGPASRPAQPSPAASKAPSEQESEPASIQGDAVQSDRASEAAEGAKRSGRRRSARGGARGRTPRTKDSVPEPAQSSVDAAGRALDNTVRAAEPQPEPTGQEASEREGTEPPEAPQPRRGPSRRSSDSKGSSAKRASRRRSSASKTETERAAEPTAEGSAVESRTATKPRSRRSRRRADDVDSTPTSVSGKDTAGVPEGGPTGTPRGRGGKVKLSG